MIQGENWQVHIGNNLDILPTLEDNSIDSIVTDPPYELGFMGKKWDSSGIAYNIELWKECLRVLKPGGHLLSFGGTRTWHRVAVAIEDAGFEVRDSIAWMYGSGFPKSLDISKAIDKGTGENKQRQLKFVNWMKSTGLTAQDCDKILKAAGKISPTSSHSIHYFNEGQPQIATADTFDILKPHLPEVPEEIERLVAERTGIEWFAYKNREVIGQNKKAELKDSVYFGNLEAAKKSGRAIGYGEFDITAPATPEAQQWEGWGTALKPAFEPIVVARKPLIGTVAANVLEHGTGGLNIDGSRIGTGEGVVTFDRTKRKEEGNTYDLGTVTGVRESNQGRWPANVILDPYTAELLDEQTEGKITQGHWANTKVTGYGEFGGGKSEYLGTGRKAQDTGGASRFFYVAKASKRDRNEGLEGLPKSHPIGGADKWTETDRRRGEGVTREPTANIHPTVKPTALMRYLVKLVTPPGGTVLDPFTGSGSTGKAAILEGFQFVGIELTEDYIPIIEGRLKHAQETASKTEEGLF